MIASRIAAVVAAAALIVGAVAIRQQLIEDGSAADAPDGSDISDATVLVCAPELAALCRESVDDGTRLIIAEAGATLDDLAADGEPVTWLTFDPFPAMVDSLRSREGKPPVGYETARLGSAPIALVATPGIATTIGTECPGPIAWRCLADLDLGTGFARSTQSGTGLLGVAQAALGYDMGGGLPVNDAQFEIWLRGVVRSVSPTQLSGGTAIDTIQTRTSSMDVAVGADAQLADARRSAFEVAYAEPMIRADVVLAAPPGTSIPSGLTDRLETALLNAGWGRPDSSPASVDAPTALAIRALWKELQ